MTSNKLVPQRLVPDGFEWTRASDDAAPFMKGMTLSILPKSRPLYCYCITIRYCYYY